MRVVVPSGFEPASLEPSCTVRTGMARISRNTTAVPPVIQGRRVTQRPKRAVAERSRDASESSRWGRKGRRPLSTRWPSLARIAGSRVTAAITATSTVIDAPRPILVMKSRPSTARAEIEMATVTPAKITARPAVEAAVVAASIGSRPSWSAWRKRLTMSSE